MRLSESLHGTSRLLLAFLLAVFATLLLLGDLGHHLLFTVHSSWHVVAPSER